MNGSFDGVIFGDLGYEWPRLHENTNLKLTNVYWEHIAYFFESFEYLNSLINLFSTGVKERRTPPTTFWRGGGSFEKNSLNCPLSSAGKTPSLQKSML